MPFESFSLTKKIIFVIYIQFFEKNIQFSFSSSSLK